MAFTYNHTRKACYLAYICQAVINNLAPLLFIIFQDSDGLSYEKLGGLILLNFLTQLVVDIVAARYADKIGYRTAMVAAHILCAAGFLLLSAAPLMPVSMFAGLGIGVVTFGIGGGLLEVLVSPIIDSLPAPSEQKAAGMSLLHSFYCWGQVAVVAITTVLLALMGNRSWQIIPLIWMLLPIINLFLFLKVPLAPQEHDKITGVGRLFRMPVFWAAMAVMVCAGASEQTISQWSSLFAEQGLGLSKVWGDLAGPCMFAVLMGLGRTFYGIFGAKIRLIPFIGVSAVLCVASYLITALSGIPVISLVGCALCGLSVSIMWPGAFSLSAARFPMGGTAMFGILAMCGDLGCASGPWLAGIVADATTGSGFFASINNFLFGGDALGLKMGILVGTLFPVIMLCCLPVLGKNPGGDI
ncbi:MAG: MFS transporter [Oscillospiraceae bacterium]|nr:MFS transporter [Oscillospiraceae bacterium]